MKQFIQFVPVQLTFFLIIGILTGNHIDFQPIKLLAIVLFLVFLLALLYILDNNLFNPSLSFSLLVFLISFFLGISSITYKNQLNKEQHYSNSSEFTTNKTISGFIEIQKALKSTAYYTKYEAIVTQLNHKKSIGKILVNIKKGSIEIPLSVGDNLVVKTQFSAFQEPLNPYSFSYKKYLKTQQIHHQIQLTKKQFLKFKNNDKTIKSIAARIRNNINNSLKSNGFNNDELAVVNALLLGQKNSITRDLLTSYAGAGAIHILAVSGLHIGIILLLLTFIFKPLHYFKNGKIIATLIIILALWIYAIIAGLSPSVVRAVTMFTALTIGMQITQRSNIYNTLVISMFFLLLFNPFYLFEVGFQLSYLAVFSIVWIQPMLYNSWKPKFWLPNKIWQLFTVSIAAQIGALPLSLFYFHQFPGLFFLSNLVIIPFLGFILIAGFVVITLSVLEILPHYLGDSYVYIIQQMNHFVSWISNQHYFIIKNISFSLLLMLAFYVFIFYSGKWIEKKVYHRFPLVLISLILVQSIFILEKYRVQTTSEFIVFNKSKSALIGARNGTQFLVYSIDSLSQNHFPLKDYLIGTGIQDKLRFKKPKNIYKFNDDLILVVDSLRIFDFKSAKPSIVVLQHSPKINLERLLITLHPKLLIADGSNYKSYVARWKETCIKNNTTFHSTMQKGAYIFK